MGSGRQDGKDGVAETLTNWTHVLSGAHVKLPEVSGKQENALKLDTCTPGAEKRSKIGHIFTFIILFLFGKGRGNSK